MDLTRPRRGGPGRYQDSSGEAYRTPFRPSTWLERTLKLEYVDSFGVGQATSGTLLDLYPAGPVLNIGGAKTLLSWDRLVLCELVED
jgi:hypothetical protein